MTKIIQYASQLFLSFESSINKQILKPVAPTLVLAGNNFHCNSQYNRKWLEYLSKSWTNVCIIPGILEHSWVGLKKSTYIDECEQRLREEIAAHSNVHYLNRNSTTVSDGTKISGLIKWPELLNKSDKCMKFISYPYKIQIKCWKEEEEEWIRDAVISSGTSNTVPHIMASYSNPYEYLYTNSFPLKGWIYGEPRATLTGYCLNRQTFIGSNSKDGPGYCPEMIMCV